MGRELQKKKNRSSLSKVKHRPKSKKVGNPRSNPIIASNWDHSETLTQNYRRLGLTSRLNSATGGIEKVHGGKTSTRSNTTARLAIQNAVPTTFTPTEAKVERDPVTGKILRVIHTSSGGKASQLNDPLNSDSDEEENEFNGFSTDPTKTEVVRQLEEQASRVAEKRPRQQSERERDWISRLIVRHGQDYAAMVRDRKLNPMQQTEADIRRRAEKFLAFESTTTRLDGHEAEV